jgi:hypothetical protein
MIDGGEVRSREVSGRTMVAVMVLFGLMMTGALFVYWELYTRPFRPLQSAIAAKFPGSSPRVVAGRHKSHLEGNPEILRLILRTTHDPHADETSLRKQANELLALVREQTDLSRYDLVEVHLMQRRPEQFTVTWSLTAEPGAFPLPTTGDLPAGVTRVIAEGQEGS